MVRNRDLRSDAGGKPSRWRFGLWALALPAAMPLVWAPSVSSVSLSPAEVASGGIAQGTVKLTVITPTQATVSLSSSNPTVATVAPSATVFAGRDRGSFKVTAVQGGAGCTTISAKLGNTAAQTALQVVQAPIAPESPLKLELSRTSLAGGNSLSATVGRFPRSATAGPIVQLSSSNPSVTVPASVRLATAEGGVDLARFTIRTAVVAPTTCAVITATHGGLQTRVVLTVHTISG